MILEIADIRIPPGKQAEFDAAIQHGVATVVVEGRRLPRGYRVVRRASSRPSATC